MRIMINIDDVHLRTLDRLASRERRSRAAMVRESISEYLDKRAPQGLGDAFGLWGDRKVDGLGYQEKVRSDW